MKNGENPMIGLDNVVIAKLLSDVGGSEAPVYDTPIPLRGAVQASVNPNSSVETDYADNGAFFVTDNRGNLEMSLEFTNIDPATKALMLGQKRRAGITVEGSQDQAPYFALGFRVWIGGTNDNGEKIYELFWFAKGKFSVPESGGTTKKDSVEFQHVSMTAQFVSTIWSPDGKGGVFSTHLRTDDPDTVPSIVNNWFNAPVLDVEADLSELTVEIAQGSSKSKLTITASKASEETAIFADSSVKLGENLIVIKNGEMVPGTVSVDGDIITFTANTEFSESDFVTVTVTSGIKDVFGVGVTPSTEVISIA